MPLKEITTNTATIVKTVNMCDICNENKSVHYCSICYRWICKSHSVKMDLELEDECIPYICTECHEVGNDFYYLIILKEASESIRNFQNLQNITLKQWKNEIKRKKEIKEMNLSGNQKVGLHVYKWDKKR